MSTVIPFFRPASARQGNWSQQELAEFYRVEAALLRAGFSIASEHGLSDEGEPWFVFCRLDGDAIIHFAKIDGSYLIASEALDRPVRGTDFRTLIDQIARLHPHLLPIPATGTGTTLVVHPAALLAALVAAAALSLSSEDAHAGPLLPGGEGVPAPPAAEGGGPVQGQPQPRASGGSGDRDTDRKQLEAIILSAMIFAAEAMAVDHRAVSAELNLDFADAAGNASSPTLQGDATLTPGTALGSGRGSVSVQPAVLTPQGSGANPDARPQSASDTIAASSRAESAPVARTEFASEAPKSPASQKQPLAPGIGSDVALTGTSAEASAAKSSGQQASTSGRNESAAPASDELGSASSDQRAGSAPASIAESASHARPAHAASSDSANVGSGSARPVWVNDLTQTVTSRTSSPEAPRDAEDRGHGRPAEAAMGSGPKADPTGPGRDHVEGVGRDRGSPAKAAAETHPTGEQAAPAHSQAGGVGQGRGVPAETATGNSPQAERGAENDRQATGNAAVQGAQAEAATGITPQAEPGRPGQGFVDSTARDRGSPAMAAGGHSPNAEQVGPGQGQAGDRGQDRGPPAAASHETPVEQTSPLNGPVNTVGPDRASAPGAASGNNPQAGPAGGGNGHAGGVARDGDAPAQAEARSNPPIEQTGRGSGHASGVAQQETSPVQADAGNTPPVEEAGRGGGHASVVARERAPQAEAAAGNNPQTVQADPSEGHVGVSGPGGARAESVIGDRPAIQQAGRGSGQENADDHGSRRPTETASRNDPPFEATGGNDGQGHGSSSQAEAAAHREPDSSAASAGHSRAPNGASERGSTLQTEAVLPGTEQQADRGNGRSPASAERSDQHAPEAHGPGATDTASSHGKPDTRGEPRSDAAPTTKAHAPPDLDSAAHGSNKLSAIDLSGRAREPTDGPAQDLTSSPTEHAQGNSVGHDPDRASNAAISELTNGDVSGPKEHGSTPSDIAVTSPSNIHAGGAGSQAWLTQDESALHGQSADAKPAISTSADRDPALHDRGSDRAEAENPLGHGASPASDAQIASPKGEDAKAGPDGSHDGAGPVVGRAIPAADPQAMVHGLDESDVSGPSGGPNLTSPSASISHDETASAHFDRGQVDGGPTVSGHGDREAPGQAARPVKANPPSEPPVQVEADLADGPLPSGQSVSDASHGASHGGSRQTKPGPPSAPPAAIDADGNLVFHTDAHQDPVPSALPHGPDQATTHHAVGLIGVSDQAHPVHDLYHHS